MSAFSTVTLQDYATSNVAFEPADINPQTRVARWLADGASFDVRPSLTLNVAYPSGSATRIKVRGKVSLPIPDTTETTLKDDEIITYFELSMPKDSSLANRRDALAYLRTALADAIVTSAVEDFESIY
jgi:hypothetical protein